MLLAITVCVHCPLAHCPNARPALPPHTERSYITGSGRLALAPPAGDERVYRAEDRLVVLG